MKISMTFQGSVTAEIVTLTDSETFEDINIEGMSREEVQEGLNSGKFLASLDASMANVIEDKLEIELSDFEVRD